MDLTRAQHAAAQEGLGGWLFYNLQHRDRISDRILGIPETVHNTRPWVYLVRAGGPPLKLVHAIEERILDSLPGERCAYASRGEFLAGLRELARDLGPVACQYSSQLPVLSYLDHGTVQVLEECGFRLRSSQALIQRFLGVLDEEGARSHEEAAVHLYAIVSGVWDRLRAVLGAGGALREGEVQAWILEEFRARGLTAEPPPVVAVGAHSSDPHYEPPADGGALLEPGRVLLLDLWARQDRELSVYADITWVGVLADGRRRRCSGPLPRWPGPGTRPCASSASPWGAARSRPGPTWTAGRGPSCRKRATGPISGTAPVTPSTPSCTATAPIWTRWSSPTRAG